MEEQFSLAKNIPSEDRENYTEETFGSLAYSFGGRISANLLSYISFDPKTGKVEEYTLANGSLGIASPDISVGIGKGIYWENNRQEIEKLTKSIGGSVSFLGITAGVDFLAKPTSNAGIIEDFFNIKGIRGYIGIGFIPLKLEGHSSFLDYGKPITENIYETYDSYFKTKSLPSAIKNYYENYNGDEKDGQHKN